MPSGKYPKSKEQRAKISVSAKKSGVGKWMKGRPVTEEHRKRTVERNKLRKGEKHWNWQGGITLESGRIRHSLEYKLWRTAVFTRDNWTCIWCGYKSRGTKPADINADHIKPFSLYPELRFAIDNGRTLCLECHRKTDTYGQKVLSKSIINKRK